MKLGISSYTYGWAVGVKGHEPAQPLDEIGLLEKAREHGVKLLQIGDNLPLNTLAADRIARLKARAIAEGVQLEIGMRGLSIERVREYARLVRALDAKLIRIVIDDVGYHPSPDEVIATLRDCVGLLDGLILGIENHDRFKAATLRDIIEATGSERIGVCLDTANSLGAGEGIQAVADVLGPLTVNLHIKDFAIARVPHQMGFNVTGRPAGQGMLDLPALLTKLPKCETAVLELWPPLESTIEKTIATEALWAQASVGYLRPHFRPAAVAE